jgi:glycerol-3-phosphate dehydrogenase
MTTPSNPPRQHGVKGVYYAGEWLDYEDCDGKFNVSESRCSGCQHNTDTNTDTDTDTPKSQELEPCPRSASRNATHQATSTDNSEYDVCIIGAGCIGAAVARELSKYSLNILWLEAADDVSQGATKGNSGIVHAGYDDKPGTNHAKYCWKGNQMFKDLDRDLRFGYQVNGSLVLCTKEEDRKILEELVERGHTNGVQNLRIVEKKELFEMEPHLNPNCIAALYAPDAGNVIPYVSNVTNVPYHAWTDRQKVLPRTVLL